MSAATLTRSYLPLDANWRLRGNCRYVDPDEMHPQDRDLYGQRQAKAVCKVCPVLDQCLTDAMDTKDYEGVRGGMTGRERRRRAAGDRGQTCADCGEKFLPRFKVQKRCSNCALIRDGRRYGVQRQPCPACGTSAYIDEDTGQLGRHRVPGADRRRAICRGVAVAS